MTVRDLVQWIDARAPFDTQPDFDNSGLLVGDPAAAVRGVLFALDATLPVIDEAVRLGANVLITHHPLLFSPVRRVLENDTEGRRVRALIRHDIHLIACHIPLDLAVGGTNDVLARLLELQNIGIDEYLRYGDLPHAMTASDFAALCAERLRTTVRVMGQGNPLLHRIGLVTGAGSEWDLAQAHGCDGFVTGEIKHHIALAACETGMTVFECGHHATEEPGIFALADALQTYANQVQWKGCIAKSQAGAYPALPPHAIEEGKPWNN